MDHVIRDSFSLSPMQSGMLFQHLYDSKRGVNIEQLVCSFSHVDVNSLQRAWKQVWEICDILRLGFDWKSTDQPAQHIHRGLDLPWTVLDWRNESNPQTSLEHFLHEDRMKGFALNHPPLMRLTLIHRGGDHYWLVWTYHHILLDGRSILLIMKQVAEAYQNTMLKTPRPYRDYLNWLEQQDWTPARAYWQEKLKGVHKPSLPKLSSTHNELNYGLLKTYLTVDLTVALKKFAVQNGLTLNTLLQGAWSILLSRYSGEKDIVFGAIRTGRYSALDGKDTRDIPGLFINTLPVRVQIDPESPVLHLLKTLRTSALELRETIYDHLPLAEIQHAGITHGALFDSIVAYENFDLDEALKAQHPMFADWDVELHEYIGYPLALEAYAGTRLKICLEYSLEFFDEDSAHRALGHLQTLLNGMIENASLPVYSLPMLTESEREKMLVQWNDTQVEVPLACVQDLFEKQVEKTPEAAALVYENQHMTYRELNQRANQLAHDLLVRGVGPGALVGVYIERSPEMIVALLGILKAGGAYLPVDPAYPFERRKHLIEDSQVSILLTQESLMGESMFGGQVALICLDRDWEQIAKRPAENPARNVSLDHLAYVIYTSGSTGKPKGAMITHRGLTNYLNWCLRAYPVEGRGSPVHSSLSFDLTVTSIYPALLSGKTVWLLPEKTHIEALEQVLKDNDDFSLVKITPAHLKLLSEQMGGADVEHKTRAFIIGGENLYPEHINFWLENAPSTFLVNEYGPTETVVGCCVYVIPRGAALQGVLPIGKPIDNTQLYVLDEYLQPLPIGVTGELYIGGMGVARGYLNQPELTAQKFIANPFRAGEHLYKTGDRARWLADGNLECLGRLDFQVKVRGYRIELGEIETALEEYPAVKQAVVVVSGNHNGDSFLTAYVTGSVSVVDLKNLLKEKLPEYMIPSAFILLDSMPLTPNGKIDRAALPDPVHRAPVAAGFTAPQTEMEQILAGLWRDILGVKRVGIYDNFFELGGHSLLATRLFIRMRETLGIEMPLRILFESPTLADLSRQIENIIWAAKQTSRKDDGGDANLYEEIIV